MADVKPIIRITYCTQCQWLLRAGWMAQELLSTFATELGEVALVPGTGERSDGETSTGERGDGETSIGERSDGKISTGERSDGDPEQPLG